MICIWRRSGRISRGPIRVMSWPRKRMVPSRGSTIRVTDLGQGRLAGPGLADQGDGLAGPTVNETPSRARTVRRGPQVPVRAIR